mgnify:CR=1 FL=1
MGKQRRRLPALARAGMKCNLFFCTDMCRAKNTSHPESASFAGAVRGAFPNFGSPAQRVPKFLPFPARPAGGRAVTGVGQMGRRPGRIKKTTSRLAKTRERWVQGGENLSPPWCSFLRLSSKRKPGSRPESGGKPRRRARPAPVQAWTTCRYRDPQDKKEEPNGNPQFVLAYQAEQDRLRALLPAGVESLRPVLRINAELRGGPAGTVYLELNTPVAAFGKRGWWNVGRWESPAHPLTARQEGAATTFQAPFLTLTYTQNRGGGRLPGGEGQRRLLLPPRGGAPLCPCGGHHRPSGLLRRGLPMGLCPPGMPRAAARTGRPCRPFPPRQRSSTPGSR